MIHGPKGQATEKRPCNRATLDSPGGQRKVLWQRELRALPLPRTKPFDFSHAQRLNNANTCYPPWLPIHYEVIGDFPMRTKIPIRPAPSGLPPVYQAQTQTYQADRCYPVVQAIHAGQIRYQSLSRGQYPGRELQRIDLPGVCLVGFWDTERGQDWGLDWHRNEGIEITFLEAGALSYACDSLEHRLVAGDPTIARPWQPHRVGDPLIAASRYHFLIIDVGVRRPHQPWVWPSWVSITERDRNEITVCMRHTTQVVWPGGAAVRHCFERIGHTVEQDDAGSHVSLLTVYLNDSPPYSCASGGVRRPHCGHLTTSAAIPADCVGRLGSA